MKWGVSQGGRESNVSFNEELCIPPNWAIYAVETEDWYWIKSNATQQVDKLKKILKDSEIFTGVGD